MNYQHLISEYGYIAVFVLMLAESACIPIPSEVIMMFGGALAGGAVTGAHPLLIGIVAAGVLGNVAGSYLAWAVGRYAGQAAIRRWGRRIGIREHEIDRATAWFERHGPVAVLIGRIVPVVRTFISLPAGFAAMPAGPFGLYTTLGCIPWTAALAIAGYALGANWQNVARDFNGPTYAIAGIIVIAVVAAIILRRRRGQSVTVGRHSSPPAGYAPGPVPHAPPALPASLGPAAPLPAAYGSPVSPAYPGSAYPGPAYPGSASSGSAYPGPAYPGLAYPGPAAYGSPASPAYPEPAYPRPAAAGYPGQAPNPDGGWGPGGDSQPIGRPGSTQPASSPWDPESRQYR